MYTEGPIGLFSSIKCTSAPSKDASHERMRRTTMQATTTRNGGGEGRGEDRADVERRRALRIFLSQANARQSLKRPKGENKPHARQVSPAKEDMEGPTRDRNTHSHDGCAGVARRKPAILFSPSPETGYPTETDPICPPTQGFRLRTGSCGRQLCLRQGPQRHQQRRRGCG